MKEKELDEYFPVSRSLLGPEIWNRVLENKPGEKIPAETLPEIMAERIRALGISDFFCDLVRVEGSLRALDLRCPQVLHRVDHMTVNPTLQLLKVSWRNLPAILTAQADRLTSKKGEEFVLLWQDPQTGKTKVRTASSEDLLALKMVAEEIEPERAAEEGKAAFGRIKSILDKAVDEGLLIRPPSRIRRNPVDFSPGKFTDSKFLSSPVFTLQWHITQACDLHCKHCYDRSPRGPLGLDEGRAILNDLSSFCRDRNVDGQVSFTGGNPLLYPHFSELYREAIEKGFTVAILGNPAPREKIEELVSIQRPSFFQVSLEGLPEHNDAVRGSGHFAKVIEFLQVLRELGIYSMVMLTLTRDNLNQILPLTEILCGKADSFTFNRLSQVGEGTKLFLPAPAAYAAFLEDYQIAAETSPVLALKDNLINILHFRKGLEPFGGCTGFGCGAAFNFLTVLPDGEVHACRKLPSYLGNALDESLGKIYDSELARRYRAGPKACRACPIRPACGGCLAVVHSHGLNVFEDRDPYCFLPSPLGPS